MNKKKTLRRFGIIFSLLGAVGIIMSLISVWMRHRQTVQAYSMAIIGGSDGPTSIFIAGKLGMDIIPHIFTAIFVVIAIVLFIMSAKTKE